MTCPARETTRVGRCGPERLSGTRTTRRIRVSGSIQSWGRRRRGTSRSETSPGRARVGSGASPGRTEKKCARMTKTHFFMKRRCAYVSSVSRSLSLVHDIVSALLAAMLMALCAMPRRLLFMSWSSMTCSLRRLTSVESAGPAGVTGASAAPASAAPAAAAPLSKGAGSGVGALSRASRPDFGLGGPVARAGRVFSAGGGAGTFERVRVMGAAAGCRGSFSLRFDLAATKSFRLRCISSTTARCSAVILFVDILCSTRSSLYALTASSRVSASKRTEPSECVNCITNVPSAVCKFMFGSPGTAVLILLMSRASSV